MSLARYPTKNEGGPPPSNRRTVCVQCKGPMPRQRQSNAWHCCSRECTLLMVGLPLDFEPRTVSGHRPSDPVRAAVLEQQVRKYLNDVILAARP